MKALLLRNLDPNDWEISQGRREGIFSVPLATRDGSRNGPREFLLQARAQVGDKLTIRTNALATRVELEKRGNDWTATGVRFLQGAPPLSGRPESCPGRAARGVVRPGSPGGHPGRWHLQHAPVADALRHRAEGALGGQGHPLPDPAQGVGQRLQDRYEVGVISEMKADFSILQGCGFKPPEGSDPADPCLEQWQANGTGLYATNGAVLALIRRSAKDLPDPDLFVFGLPGTFKGYFLHYAEGIEEAHNHFTWAILKAHTKNTAGTVTLRSKDPREMPEINFRYFDEGSDQAGEDLRAVVEGVKLVRQIMSQDPLARLVVRNELIPGGDISNDGAIADVIKKTAWGHHACGTCKIGGRC